ncbi:hypothetical protein AX17_000785 [Amanita inopinata Kibby_2008]|nr:hypothetical protein AX17_000785 [Amanita inopinata Kibby_2008]
MLLVNLLSSYLPSPDGPDYHRRLEKLPEYRESLHARYPPVCDSCLPAVEEEIRSKDHMARTKALDGWLKKSKGKDRLRRVSATSKDRDHLTLEMLAWRIRGALWTISLFITILGHSAVALRYSIPSISTPLQSVLPILVITSLLWTAWDPTYLSFKKAQLQGRDVRVRGKQLYICLQMTVWSLRLATSIMLAIKCYRPDFDVLHLHDPNSQRARIYSTFVLAIECFVLASSLSVLHLQLPPAIRLIDTKSHNFTSRSVTPIVGSDNSRSATPAIAPLTAAEPDLSALTLSSKPVISPPKPVFGYPSWPSASIPPSQTEEVVDEMDWAPTDPLALSSFQKQRNKVELADDGSWIRPQRFFAPEQPTGLEGLFEKTRLADEVPPSLPVNNWYFIHNHLCSHLQSWWRLYTLSLATAIIGVGYYTWWISKTSSRAALEVQ